MFQHGSTRRQLPVPQHTSGQNFGELARGTRSDAEEGDVAPAEEGDAQAGYTYDLQRWRLNVVSRVVHSGDGMSGDGVHSAYKNR